MSVTSQAALERALKMIVSGLNTAEHLDELTALMDTMSADDLRTFHATVREILDVLKQVVEKATVLTSEPQNQWYNYSRD